MNTVESKKEINKNMKWLHSALIAALTSAFSLIGLYLYNFSGGLSQDNDKWGTFGDFLGGTINPILGFLSFIALITTIRLQLQELNQTRDELKRSADAHSASENHLKKQALALEEQRFESSFYALLTHHNMLLREITTSNNNHIDRKSNLDMVHAFLYTGGTLDSATKELMSRIDMFNNYFEVVTTMLEYISQKDNKFRIGNFIQTETSLEIKNSAFYSEILKSFITNRALLMLSIFANDINNSTARRLYTLLEEMKLLRGITLNETPLAFEIKRRYPRNFTP